jgi:hypothetical protein
MSFTQSVQPMIIPDPTVLPVSNSLTSITLTCPSVSGGNDAKVNKISPLLYPTVGESYLVNLNVVLAASFNSAPTAGTLGVILQYENAAGDTAYVSASSYKVVATGTIDVTYGFNTSLSLIFTHTVASNRLAIVIDNLTSNSIIGNESVFNVDCGVVNLGTRTNTITSADFI